MIQFFRNLFSSKLGVVIALLFIVLIALAFALADINAPTGMFSGSGDEIASVGDESVSEDRVGRMANRALTVAREQSPGADMQTFIDSGGLDQILEQYSNALALGAFARDNGIIVGKRLIDAAIASTPAFQGLSGQFDENTFRQILQSQNLTEQEVRGQLRDQRLFRLILAPAGAGARMTNSAVRPYAQLLFERRSGRVIAIPSASVAETEEPSTAQINQFYRVHLDRYTLPERRAVRYAVFTRAQLDDAAPTDAQIRTYYEEHQAEYAGTETRRLRQIVLPSEVQARAFYNEVHGGADFAAAANRRGFSENSTLVETDSRESFARGTSPAVAAAAFGAREGELAQPTRSDFGWHVIRVEQVESHSGQSLAAARPEIISALRAELADQALADKYLAIENAIDEGASFAEVAEAQGLSITTTPLVTPNGRSPDNPGFSPPPELPSILEGAFSMDAEEDPLLVSIEDNQRYALVDVTRIAPSAPQPLASIRRLVARDYLIDRASRRARQVAAGIAQRINNGDSIAEAMAAADVDLPAPQSASTTRQAMAQLENVPAPLQLMFRMAENTAKLVRLPANQGWFVVVLENIETDTDQLTDEILAASGQQFGQVLSNEYSEQFLNAVMADYPLERDEDAIRTLSDRLTGRSR